MTPEQGTNETQRMDDMQVASSGQGVGLESSEPVASVVGEVSNDLSDSNNGMSQLVPKSEVNQNLSDNEIVHNDGAQGTSGRKINKMMVGMIVFGVIAVSGIGFGVWAMVSSNSQKEQYESKINTLNQQNSKLKKELEDTGSTVVVDDEVDEEIELEAEPVKNENTSAYIYIGAWGLKIKISSELEKVGYAYVQNADSTKVNVFGAMKRSGSEGAFPDFANMNKNTIPLGTVTRSAKGTEMPIASAPELVFSDEQYDYYYSHPQAVYSDTEDEGNWEIDSVDVVKDMLKNKDNYSSF